MGGNLSDLVRDAAAQRPDHPAIIAAGRTTSWAELDRLVYAVAGGLTAKNLQVGERVAISASNSLEFVISYFGILRAGLVAVPLNTGYTSVELTAMLRDCGARIVICDSTTQRNVTQGAPAGVEIIATGTPEWRSLMVGKTPPRPDPVSDEDLAVLLFTSGSEGRPKAAMLSHRAMMANLEQLDGIRGDVLPMVPDDVVMVVLPLFHVYALNATLGYAVRHGATSVLADRFDAVDTLRLIKDHRVTNIAGAPPMYSAWSSMPHARESMAHVRLLVSGASPLPRTVYDQFDTMGLTIWEGYGMTEAAPVITNSLVNGRAKRGFVGAPLPGIDVELRDENGETVKEGDPGEIYVRGANLFTGYWPDGTGGPDEDGWFATGDVAYADDDGDLRLVDRLRDLILVSGFNVYPREIEDVIAAMPGVAEVAVVGVSHPYTGEAVKAIVVPAADAQLTSEDVLEHCSKRLARFKNPTIVDVTDQLPHTSTGKIAKAQLRG